MKYIFLVATLALFLTACEKKVEVKSVEYYKKHLDEARTTFENCIKNHSKYVGGKGFVVPKNELNPSLENCLNADKGMKEVQRESLEKTPQYKSPAWN